ncbi:cytochrome P450 6a22 [Culex quinquefasciatus]|uniref:Cytochrome P450 6a22 n=1 Tax=Culex quinquefasciatus TaxID=7176 RepID=B0WVF0_CULQU|nr:cytochrome P450 6a22 [Culex quinquefasciatus]|eukprot:XP_001861372.1 cytochrome P450 6a22 [Culex quinquefasciatus]
MILYLLLSILVLSFLWIQRQYSYWERRGVPYVKASFPRGNLQGVGKKFHMSTAIQACYNKLKGKGPFGGIFFFLNPVVLVMDLELVKHVLVKDFQFFHDRSLYYNEKDDPLTGNLLNIEGTRWRNLRAKITPTFTSGKMKMMFPTIVAIADQFHALLVRESAEGVEMEMKEALARFTTDVIGRCAFGLECDSLSNPESIFRQMGSRLFSKRSFRLVVAQQFRELARFLGYVTFDKEVSTFFLNIVRETIEYREESGVSGKDFMDLMIKLKNSESIDDSEGSSLGALTFNEIAAQAVVFFAAGFETSATTMSYCLYELALNPALQGKARDEVTHVIRKHGILTYEAAQEMQYVGACIDEALRKYPPGPSLSRAVTKNYKVPNTNTTLEKGTSVLIPVYAIHHDPEYFPEPERYVPDRFLPEQQAARNPYSYLPFGEGPRNCIGLRFGLTVARIGVAYVLKGFRISLSRRTPVPLELSRQKMILTIEGGLWLHLEKL